MRSVFFSLLLLFTAAGCMPRLSGPVQLPEQSVTTFDFTPYAAQGFLFTPAHFEGAYETRGMIELVFRPSPAEVMRRLEEVRQGQWTSSADARVAPLLQKMVETARGLGADGIMQFSIQVDRDGTGLATYRLSGYAIKRN